MTTKKTEKAAPRMLRAVVDLALRQSPDRESPLYEEWFEWPAGTVFEPPAHLKVERALERGIAVWDGDAEAFAQAAAAIEARAKAAAAATAALAAKDEIEDPAARRAREEEDRRRREDDEKRHREYMAAYEVRVEAERIQREREAGEVTGG